MVWLSFTELVIVCYGVISWFTVVHVHVCPCCRRSLLACRLEDMYDYAIYTFSHSRQLLYTSKFAW